MLSALALVTRRLAYPANALQKLWKLVLTNQFHDIIPGSSIGEVYADSTKDYAVVLEQAAALHKKALQALTPDISTPETDKVFVFNTLSFPRTEVVDLGGRFGLVSAPALGYAIQTPATTTETVSVTETETGFILENTLLKAVFNRQGGLTSLFDKSAQRESIEPGQAGNTFVLYEDLPNAWEAWDVDAFHLEKKLPVNGATSAKIAQTGPLRASLVFEYHLSPESVLQQAVSLDALSARLDFACQVDWQEKQKFLKVEFPLNIRAQSATYEIQFGHVQRPTHFNTSYDMARFEVPAHKWADLSEPDFGVALLNDCKYGYAAHGNILRLSLLRAPTYPDAKADQGRHHFRFALYPHKGSPQSAGVTEAACCFNVPLLTAKSGGQDIQQAFFSLDQPAVLLDTIKKAEDSEALILRLYEARGTRGKLRLTSSLPIQSAALVNLLEDEMSPLNWQDGGVELSFKPFEIITLRLNMVKGLHP
jgi:alpha-mannosidase